MTSRDGYAVGVPGAHREIKSQHQRLTALVQRIERMIRQQRSSDSIARLLQRLINAAEAHFDYEAYVQNALGLRGKAYHQGSHIRPTTLVSLRDAYAARRPPSPIEAIDTLNQWLHHHRDESIVNEIERLPEMSLGRELKAG